MLGDVVVQQLAHTLPVVAVPVGDDDGVKLKLRHPRRQRVAVGRVLDPGHRRKDILGVGGIACIDEHGLVNLTPRLDQEIDGRIANADVDVENMDLFGHRDDDDDDDDDDNDNAAFMR